MASNIVYGPQVVVDSNLALWYDMASPKCWDGNVDVTNTLKNLSPQSSTYPTIGWDATSSTRTGYGHYIPRDVAVSGSTFQTIYGNNTSSNSNSVGNFMEGAGNISLTLSNDFTTSVWHAGTFPRQATLLAYRRASFQLRFAVDSDSMDFNQRHGSSPYGTTSTNVSVTSPDNTFACYTLVKAGLTGAAAANYSFYKNGEHIGTNSMTMSEEMIAGNYYDIGQDWSDDDYYSNNSEGFYGPIMHYTRALSHAEVKQNFNSIRSRFNV